VSPWSDKNGSGHARVKEGKREKEGVVKLLQRRRSWQGGARGQLALTASCGTGIEQRASSMCQSPASTDCTVAGIQI
jgi:hypothetical protein